MILGEQQTIKMTYGALIFIVGMSLGLVGWITSIEVRGNIIEEDLVELRTDATKIGDLLYGIDKRLSRIEILLEKQK